MARGRMISKAISLDEKVNSLSDDTARLLFTWLIAHLDCEGRMHGDPTTVKSIVFPRRNISPGKIEKYLKELENSGLILRYFVNGNQYLCAPTFEKHQKGLRKNQEAPSQIPPFTTDLQRGNNVSTLLQVKTKDKVKEETKEETNPPTPLVASCLSKEDVIKAYEENICLGTISEDMENEITLAIKRFTAAWVIDAIKEAVAMNKRTWYYTAGILKNWQRYGKGAKFPKRR